MASLNILSTPLTWVFTGDFFIGAEDELFESLLEAVIEGDVDHGVDHGMGVGEHVEPEFVLL